MPLRIALTHAFCWPEVPRGGERILHELAGALKRRGHHVTIISGEPWPSVSTIEDVRVYRLPRGRKDDVFRAERIFGEVVYPALVAGRFDVVHSLGARDAVASIRAKEIRKRRRTVYTNLGLPLRSSWERRPDGAAHQRVVDEVDVYGTLSRYARSVLQEDYGRTGALTLGGVRLERFIPRVERAEEPTLLYSGALNEPRKGVAELLRAVAILAETESRVRLWLAGPGDARPLLDAAPPAARERTTVLPLATPNDQPDRFAAAWATVLASRFETFGLVLIESLACGTPVVACNHAAPPEIVTPGIGVLAPLNDDTALAQACAQALGLSREAGIRERCREAARRYDWDEAIAPACEALYLGTERDSAA